MKKYTIYSRVNVPLISFATLSEAEEFLQLHPLEGARIEEEDA